MAKAEYLMLAHTFKPGRHNIGGWFMSEKLDGTRAFWDGGISRGIPASEVPYANTYKDSRLIEAPVATGLWSRSGKVIHAPAWWLDDMPSCLLDGELFIKRGEFQQLRKIVADHVPDEISWRTVNYCAFDVPSVETMFRPRTIKVRNEYDFVIKPEAYQWAIKRGVIGAKDNWDFSLSTYMCSKRCSTSFTAYYLKQEQLPNKHLDAIEIINDKLETVLGNGGEGVMLRKPSSFWVAERSHNLLKHKPWYTAEGTVTGYTFGVEGKTGQLLGLMGALIVDFEGRKLKLSGFTHAQRNFNDPKTHALAVKFPGQLASGFVTHPLYPRGTIVEFKYRELSDDGVPKEARFWRIRGEE